jgi:hypothetical protein
VNQISERRIAVRDRPRAQVGAVELRRSKAGVIMQPVARPRSSTTTASPSIKQDCTGSLCDQTRERS